MFIVIAHPETPKLSQFTKFPLNIPKDCIGCDEIHSTGVQLNSYSTVIPDAIRRFILVVRRLL